MPSKASWNAFLNPPSASAEATTGGMPAAGPLCITRTLSTKSDCAAASSSYTSPSTDAASTMPRCTACTEESWL